MESVRLARQASVRAIVLDRYAVGVYRDQPADLGTVRTARLCLRSCLAARSTTGAFRGVLGAVVSAGRSVRGISPAGLHLVHARARHRLLARGISPVVYVWIDSPAKRRRAVARPSGRGVHRILLLSDVAAYWQSMVCRRLPRCLGLGRDFLLFRAR